MTASQLVHKRCRKEEAIKRLQLRPEVACAQVHARCSLAKHCSSQAVGAWPSCARRWHLPSVGALPRAEPGKASAHYRREELQTCSHSMGLHKGVVYSAGRHWTAKASACLVRVLDSGRHERWLCQRTHISHQSCNQYQGSPQACCAGGVRGNVTCFETTVATS